MPEVLENKSERVGARPTLLHSSAMVGHRVGFVSALHCKPEAWITKCPTLWKAHRVQGSFCRLVLITIWRSKIVLPQGMLLAFLNASFYLQVSSPILTSKHYLHTRLITVLSRFLFHSHRIIKFEKISKIESHLWTPPHQLNHSIECHIQPFLEHFQE